MRDYTFTKTYTRFYIEMSNQMETISYDIYLRDTGNSYTAFHLYNGSSYTWTYNAASLLTLSQDVEPGFAFQLTVDNDYSVPTVIRQVEPATIAGGLSLNQNENETIVEYVLDKGDAVSSSDTSSSGTLTSPSTSTGPDSTTDDNPFPWITGVVAIPIIVLSKRRKV